MFCNTLVFGITAFMCITNQVVFLLMDALGIGLVKGVYFWFGSVFIKKITKSNLKKIETGSN